MKEFITLLGVAVENYRFRRQLRRQERKLLGEHSWYRALDRELARTYRWSNPFTLSKRAKRKLSLPREDLIYGETPLLTAWSILSDLGVDQADHIVECGGGRALFSLVAVSAFGCSATTLEIIPAFVKKTQKVVDRLGLERLQVIQSDILAQPIPQGSVYFITATTFSTVSWRKLEQNLTSAPAETRAISLSAPLSKAYWRLEKETKLPFSWGENTVYIQRRRAAEGSAPPENASEKPDSESG